MRGKIWMSLFGLITDGEQQMKDDERIKRIDKLYADMQDKQMFVQVFSAIQQRGFLFKEEMTSMKFKLKKN